MKNPQVWRNEDITAAFIRNDGLSQQLHDSRFALLWRTDEGVQLPLLETHGDVLENRIGHFPIKHGPLVAVRQVQNFDVDRVDWPRVAYIFLRHFGSCHFSSFPAL